MRYLSWPIFSIYVAVEIDVRFLAAHRAVRRLVGHHREPAGVMERAQLRLGVELGPVRRDLGALVPERDAAGEHDEPRVHPVLEFVGEHLRVVPFAGHRAPENPVVLVDPFHRVELAAVEAGGIGESGLAERDRRSAGREEREGQGRAGQRHG
jgi:hypothetical protein